MSSSSFRLFVAALGLTFAAASRGADAPAAGAASDPADLQRQLSESRDELATALHSYSILEDENRQLKERADKNAAKIEDDQRMIDSLKTQVPIAAQAETLRSQVRQLQDQAAELAREVLRLKTLLALRAPSPGAAGSTPTRPSAH